ncbi:hypothetical protein IWW50_007095, partial [Coemansia erecta]
MLATVPSLGLLLVNIHGPPSHGTVRTEFFHDLLALLATYQRSGWKIIVGGDFNIAPFQCDRDSENDSEAGDAQLIRTLRNAIGLMDVLHHAHPWYCLSQGPRHHLFTHYVTSYTNGIRSDSYVSRIDYFLVDHSLAQTPGISADALMIDKEAALNLDHKMVHLKVPPSSGNAPPRREGYRLDANRLNEPTFVDYVDSVFKGRVPAPLANTAYPPNAITPCDLMSDAYGIIHAHSIKTDRRKNTTATRQTIRFYKLYQDAAMIWDDEERDRLRAKYERKMRDCLVDVTRDARIRAARTWIDCGDRLTEWFKRTTKASVNQRTHNKIPALRR